MFQNDCRFFTDLGHDASCDTITTCIQPKPSWIHVCRVKMSHLPTHIPVKDRAKHFRAIAIVPIQVVSSAVSPDFTPPEMLASVISQERVVKCCKGLYIYD